MDLTETTRVDLTARDMADLAAKNVFEKHAKRAIVVTSDLHYGLARMFEMMRESHGEEEIVVFRSMREALAWLGLEKEPDRERFPKLKSGKDSL